MCHKTYHRCKLHIAPGCAFPRGREAIEFVMCAARQRSNDPRERASPAAPRCPGIREDLVMLVCAECLALEAERDAAARPPPVPPVPPKSDRRVPMASEHPRDTSLGGLFRRISRRGRGQKEAGSR